MTISPCIYPRCDDGTGNPVLTTEGACRVCRHRYRRLINHLVLDWARLRTEMPAPTAQPDTTRRTQRRVYGHPAEWASDSAADIANKLNWTHDALADHLGDRPPPHPGTTERGRIQAAYTYLEPRIHQLVTIDSAADIATELAELHHRIRANLGYTRLYQRLPGVPCLNCSTMALVLIDNDTIECGECGETIRHELFGLIARHAVDSLIDRYDAEHDTPTEPTQLA